MKIFNVIFSAFLLLAILNVGIYSDNWEFIIKDSFKDSTYLGEKEPGSVFEVYGMGFKKSGNELSFAFNSNLSLTGTNYYGKHIGWGDFIINSGDLSSYNNLGSNVYGVHFVGTDSDSNIQVNGLYSVTETETLASSHYGWNTIQEYLNAVGDDASLGGMSYEDGYFDTNQAAPTSIKTGTKIAEINLLSTQDLPDFSSLFSETVGDYTFGFSFLMPSGMSDNFVGHLTMECANDMIAIKTPEPASVISLIIGFLAVIGKFFYKK